MPNEATAANRANAPAPSKPHHGVLPSFSNARRHAYIAPPSMLPLWSFTRYFTAANVSEYFVAMPNTPVSHIHSTAPGSFVTDSLMAVGSLRWMNRVRIVRYRCEPNSSTIIGGPHTKASISLIIWTMSMHVPSLVFASTPRCEKRAGPEAGSERRRHATKAVSAGALSHAKVFGL